MKRRQFLKSTCAAGAEALILPRVKLVGADDLLRRIYRADPGSDGVAIHE